MMPTKGPGAYGYGRYGYAYGYGIEEDADRQTASKQPKQPKRGRLKAARGTER